MSETPVGGAKTGGRLVSSTGSLTVDTVLRCQWGGCENSPGNTSNADLVVRVKSRKRQE